MAIALRYAARSDVGLVRQNNQDSGYAARTCWSSPTAWAGTPGATSPPRSRSASSRPWTASRTAPTMPSRTSSGRSARAHGELLARVQEEPQLAGMGTTITALMRAGNRLALAHIGDSRAYLLRDGVLTQITKDHTFVQTLVDEGRLTPEEAEHHPQRSVLMRVLSDIVDDPEPDFSIRESRVGDRYLLCSDGLSGVVSFETLQETLASSDPPGATCERLVALARGPAPPTT